jgi:hypothetical protein
MIMNVIRNKSYETNKECTMKKMLFVLVAFAMLFGLAGAPAASAQVAASLYCGVPQVVDLLAGQSIPAGTVTIANDANNLYITYNTEGTGWYLSETHLHVADSLASIPQTKNGNPKIGNFDYQASHNPFLTEYTYTISKSQKIIDGFKNVVVAAHAVVVKLNESGSVIANETGWGKGDQFNVKGSWAMFINYTWQDCNTNVKETKTETAFAFGGDYAKCFDQFDVSNRWGWSNGPLTEGSYIFDIYASAGQCNLSKGTKVGTLNVNYSNGTAEVTYQLGGSNPETGLPYTLTETHLYVGNEPLARNNGEFTVAPGQFPYINSELFTTSRTYTVTGLNGEIYIVAHATVGGFSKED